ncbi:MAG: hypothetical protein U0231_18685 [Nitrospiraceae bacterium]
MQHVSTSGFRYVRGTVSIYPVSAEISGALNQFVEGAGFDHIAIGPGAITGLQVSSIVGAGQDDDRDVQKADVLFDLPQGIQSQFSSQFQIKQYEGWLISVDVIVEVFHGGAVAVGDHQFGLDPGLDKGSTEEFAFAGTVVDQQYAGMKCHQVTASARSMPGESLR